MSKKEGYSRPGLFGGQQRNLRRLESLRRLIENEIHVQYYWTGRSTTKNLPFTYLTNPVKILLYNCRKTNYN